MKVRGAIIAIAGMLLLSLTFALPAAAQVKPGELITADQANKVKDLVSPGVYYKVVRGMSMKIIPTQRVDWPPPYHDATEKYADKSGSRLMGEAYKITSRANRSHFSM